MPAPSDPKPMHFVSASCGGEWCAIHYRRNPALKVDATHKVEETILHDDPLPIRHPLVAYLCCSCFVEVVGPAAPCL